MHVAELSLCKELYELSGWGDTSEFYVNGMLQHGIDTAFEDHAIKTNYPGYSPAYDLGYLLRKLPSNYMLMWHDFEDFKLEDGEVIKQGRAYVMSKLDGDMYEIDEDFWNADQSDTPEDAAAKLAIELFKQKILTRES